MSTVFHPPWLSNIPLSDAPKLEKAMHADLTPLEFDPEEGYAEFSSKHAHYQTTLSACVCGEHPCGGGFPCKHMYRLAMMMGLLPGNYKNDPYKIKYPRNGISLPEAIARLETVSPAAQRYLYRHIQSLRGYEALPIETAPTPLQEELEQAQLLVRIDDPNEYRLHPDLDRASWKLYRYLCQKYE